MAATWPLGPSLKAGFVQASDVKDPMLRTQISKRSTEFRAVVGYPDSISPLNSEGNRLYRGTIMPGGTTRAGTPGWV